MTRGTLWLMALASLAGCADPSDPTGNSIPTDPGLGAGRPALLEADRGRHERLARRIALALKDDDFRHTVLRAFQMSPFREGKVHLQAFMEDGDGREIRRVARRAGESDQSIRADLDQARPIELYMPVPAHRLAWKGTTDVLVATGEVDGDAPVGFDVDGRRVVLDPRTPPNTPVISLVRAEQDFAKPPQGLLCVFDCDGTLVPIDPGGSGGSTPPSQPGLYLTRAQFDDTYEGWLKGAPELEVHVLGQVGQGDSLTTYQCASETLPPPYYYNQDDKGWTGNVLLISQAQIDQYKLAHPNQNLRIFVVEDDDGSCEIRLAKDRMKTLLNNLKVIYGDLTGGMDSTKSKPTGGLDRFWKRANMFLIAFRAARSLIVTQDDPLGNAVDDPAAAAPWFPGANWVIRGEANAVHGALRLEVRQ